MITKNQIRFVKSLQQKKYRNENELFVVEGRKSVGELLKSELAVNDVYVSRLSEVPKGLSEYTEISEKDMQRISGMKTAPGILAVVESKEILWDTIAEGLTVILDGINDPGNLGTIIRTADWFGVKRIICSKETVDKYNPKVIQATMGSFFHIPVYYESLSAVIDEFNKQKSPTFAAILDGDNLYKTNFPANAAIIIGSESHGISPEVIEKSSNSVTIPSFGQAESLNASIATAVILGKVVG